MAAAELRLVADGLDRAGADDGRVPPIDRLGIGEIERIVYGRAQRLRFGALAGPEGLAAPIGQLSASAALFRHHGESGGAELLEPVPIAESLVYGSELVTTQRYRGKTNERLTRAMLNAALATAGIDPSSPTGTVLDPMCGRGTTLNWALAYGLNAIGIDLDGTSLDHHASFVQTWAKRQRLPHKAQRHRPRNAENRSLTLEVGPDRQSLKSGRGQRLETFRADGGGGDIAIKAGSVDVVVTDLPYGVQHRGSEHRSSGNEHRGGDSGGGVDRPETLELLARSLPAWYRWLRPGGGLCLAWNTKRATRRELGHALVTAGFTPVVAVGGFSMRHTVDATIDRDVIVARR